MRIVLISTCVGLALAGCSKRESDGKVAEKLNSYDVAPQSVAAPQASGNAATTPIAVTLPKIAYDYKYSFRLPGDAVGATKQAHIVACDKLGLAKCQLVSSESSSGQDSAATLKLRVASDVARTFGAQLIDSVAKAGGRAIDQSISAEDVSKEMSDTNARIRQRELLVQRLTQILQNRTGKVGDLVEAERSVAAAQEELDQAKAWLAELQGRVAMSNIEIGYNAIVTPATARGPLSETVGQSWSLFTTGLDAILRLIIFLLPWAAIAAAIGFGVRAIRRQRLSLTDAAPPEEIASAAEEPMPVA